MISQNAFVILNPAAGKRSGDTVRAALEKHFEPGRYEVYETTGEEDMPRVIDEALAEENYDWVLACGGDGTVSEVADGLDGRDIPLAIVPVGTSNSLAQELGIPTDPAEALSLLAGEPRPRKIDGMRVGERLFLLHIGLGLSSAVMADTSREAKNRWGVAAYFATLVRRIRQERPRRVTMTLDGQRRVERATEIMIANAAAFGLPGIHWGSHIAPDDGRIDICLVGSRTFADYAKTFWGLLTGQPESAPPLSYYAARQSIHIRTEPETPVEGDGELVGDSPVTIEVVPEAITILVPPD